MSESKALCAVCGYEHRKGECEGAPGTLERREWELGKTEGYDDWECGRVNLDRARRSPYYLAGYRRGIEIAKLDDDRGRYEYDREEFDEWQR